MRVRRGILASAFLAALTLSGVEASDASRQRLLPGGDTVAVVLDEDRNEIEVVVTGGDSGDTTRSRHKLGAEVLDGLCMGLEEGRPQLYVFDSRGYLGQWLLATNDDRPEQVRYIPGVVEALDCFVDDTAGDLFVLEENIGVWRYGAWAGAKYDRELLLRYLPAGVIDPGVEEFRQRDKALMVGSVVVPRAEGAPAALSPLPTVQPFAETAPVAYAGDAADDPAIWHNPQQPGASRILAADKRFGLRVYDLQGRELQSIPAGRLNNVDLRSLPQPAPFVALAAASNRSLGSISLFGIASDGEVTWLTEDEVQTDLDDPYGLCMNIGGRGPQVFINDKDGRLQQWYLEEEAGRFHGTLQRELQLEDQPEGCVADDSSGRLFFGIEDRGLYTLSIEPDGQAPVLLAPVDSDHLFADVEGMDLYITGDSGFLVVSSQGNASFAVFDRQPPHRWRGNFRIASNDSEGIDGVSDTDGLAVHSGNFGPGLERGLIVVQDGYNVMPREAQNFKLLSWAELARVLELESN